MAIPLHLGVKGRVKVKRTDTRTGQVDYFEKDNLLLSDTLNRVFTHGVGLLTEAVMDTCHIGTSTQTPTRADAGCQGTVLASNSIAETISPLSMEGVYPLFSEYTVISGGLATARFLTWAPEAKYLAAGTEAGLSVFKRTGEAFAILPVDKHPVHVGANVRGISFSANGFYMAIVHDTDKRITVFKIDDNDTFVKLDSPDEGLAGSGYCCEFSPDSLYLAAGCYSAPYLKVYKRNGDTFTSIPFDPALPGTCNGVGWSHDGVYLAAGHNGAPYITVYKRVGDTFTKLTTVDALAEGSGAAYSASFSHDSRYMAVSTYKGEGYAVYERDGDTLTRLVVPEVPGTYVLKNMVCFAYDPVSGEEVLFALPTGSAFAAFRMYNGRFLPITMPPRPSELGIDSVSAANLEWLAITSYGSLYVAPLRITIDNTLSLKRRWVFPAGVGTGAVGETVLQSKSDSYIGLAKNWVARQVFDPPITKGEFHQLDVEWEISFTKPPEWTGTFVGGQRDGLTNVNWAITLNNRQFLDLVRVRGAAYKTNSLAVWCGISQSDETPAMLAATGNDASRLALDWMIDSYGETLIRVDDIASQLQTYEYIPDSFEREFRITIPVTQANGDIGELILWAQCTWPKALCRITFNPPLDKVDTYELHLNFKIGLVPS